MAKVYLEKLRGCFAKTHHKTPTKVSKEL